MARHDMTRLSEGNSSAVFYDVELDELWQVRGDNREKFNAGSSFLTAEWISKPYVVAGARAYSSARLDLEGTTEISLYEGDNELIQADHEVVPFWSKVINHIKAFRLGSSGRKRSLCVGFKLIDGKRLRRGQIARDMREVA